MAADPVSVPLSGRQAARRQSVITAALGLASEGGYDAVQMRDVAAKAGVALGTIYRYFSSKDHVLAAGLVDWVGELESRVSQRPPVGDTNVERVVNILRRAVRTMEREPKLAEAVVSALTSSDANAAECQRLVSEGMARLMSAAFTDEVPPDRRADITRVLGHVWLSALVGWVNGWSGIGKVGDEVELAAHLLLDGYG